MRADERSGRGLCLARGRLALHGPSWSVDLQAGKGADRCCAAMSSGLAEGESKWSCSRTALPKQHEKIEKMAQKHNATIAQINIAWLLHKSEWMLPIPGTSSLKHFEENLKATDIKLSVEDMEYLG